MLFLSMLKVKLHQYGTTEMSEQRKDLGFDPDALRDKYREERDKRLASCDWVVTKALESGGAVPSDWVTYRTALRDITAHDNWPNLASPDMDGSGGDWPEAPNA